MSGLCLSLAYAVVATGMAGHYENKGDGEHALRWRGASPTALALHAERLERRDEAGAAGAMARTALGRSSLQGDALRALAMSIAVGGRADEALTIMMRAGSLNPRDVQTQGWLYQQAMARGDYRGAVLHADRLMRCSPQSVSPLSFALAPLLTDAAARAEFARRISVDPPWRTAFLSVIGRVAAADDVVALYEALKHTRSPITDAEATALFNRLVVEAKYREAKGYFDEIWGQPDRKEVFVYDGEFSGRPGPPPLNWQPVPSTGGSARWTRDDAVPLGNMRVSHDGFSSSGPLARQLILIPPGAYQMTARARVDDSGAASRFKIQIICIGGAGSLISMPVSGVPGLWVSSKAGFTIPIQSCEAQWLLIMPVTGDRREIAEMLVDDIVIHPAAVGSLQRQGAERTP